MTSSEGTEAGQSDSGSLPAHVGVAIVGTGFAGLGMAIRLKQAGRDDFVVLERAEDLGGTWRDNSYPGCACDVPSHLYSFSFAPNPRWSRTFSGQAEIWSYLREVTERAGIGPHLRFGAELLQAAWDQTVQVWRIETARGAMTADALVAGMGPLSDPAVPHLPGLTSFAGRTFHSAAWDHSDDLSGRKVAVIGTGASSIQFIPQIAPRVEALTVFQRTAPWIMPRRDRRVTAIERFIYTHAPAAQRAMRAGIFATREVLVLGLTGRAALLAAFEKQALKHLRAQVGDPALRATLTPRYRLGCKRILISNDYYPALARDNVQVATDTITEVVPTGIRTEDGTVHEADTLIFATGFHVTDMAVGDRVRGIGGQSLDDVWQGSPTAYLGTTVAGFPNFFLLVGPNTGLGHSSIVYMIESQVPYIVQALDHARRCGPVDVRPEVAQAYNAKLQRQMSGTVWTDGGCKSWYLDRHGRNSTLWPDFTFRFRRLLRRFNPADYRQHPRRVEATEGDLVAAG
ncbi:MAG TPA: NAD(P)/FAD-dependent oxidoreductase [Mycobacteriales bacterium]|nr:NAD(P)/FAD-dependent oxidoreductase [Mycobacteriales bacterium]